MRRLVCVPPHLSLSPTFLPSLERQTKHVSHSSGRTRSAVLFTPTPATFHGLTMLSRAIGSYVPPTQVSLAFSFFLGHVHAPRKLFLLQARTVLCQLPFGSFWPAWRFGAFFTRKKKRSTQGASSPSAKG